MTVATSTNRNEFTGNGTIVVFDYTFVAYDSTNIKIEINDVEQTSGFTVTRNSNNVGGRITFSTAPANGARVLIRREIPITQLLDLVRFGRFPAESIERALDEGVMIDQQLAERIDEERTFTETEVARILSSVLNLSGGNNTMGQPINMAGNQISNLPAPNSLDSPARLRDVTSTQPIQLGGVGRRMTSTEAIAEDAEVGTLYTLTDRREASYIVVDASDTGGLYPYTLASGRRLRLLYVNGFIPVFGHADFTGASDTSTQLVECVAAAEATGLPLLSNSADIYHVGTFADDAARSIMRITADGFIWLTNNCEFTGNASIDEFHDGQLSQVIFEVEASDSCIGDFRATADQIARDGSDRQGIIALWYRNSTRNTRNCRVGAITGTRLVACITATSTDPANLRLRGLEHGKLFNNEGYYTMNNADNADNVSGIAASNDCIRTWFCYGVSGYNSKVETTNHRQFTDVVVARLGRNTSDITIDYSCQSTATSSGLVSLEHLNDDADSTISNVTINFDTVVSNPANPTVNFNALSANGTPQATTTKRWIDIRLNGQSNSTQPIRLNTQIVGNTPSSIYVESNDFVGNRDTRGFNFIFGHKRLAFATAATNLAARFNVSDLIFTPSWGKLVVFATNDYASAAGISNYIQREYYINISVASNGAITIGTPQQISDRTVTNLNPAISITMPSQSAGSYQFVVQGNNFTGSNAIIKCFLELHTGIRPF